MWRWLRDLLYGEERAEFSCPYPPEVAIQRLRNVTSRSVLNTLFREGAIGRIAADRIVLRRYRPWFHNDFRPTFVGKLLVEDGHTFLRGGFRLGAYPKVLMTIWLGFAAFWTVVVTIITILDPKIWWFPFAGLGMFAFGILFVAGAKRMSRSDAAWLAEHIRRALT